MGASGVQSLWRSSPAADAAGCWHAAVGQQLEGRGAEGLAAPRRWCCRQNPVCASAPLQVWAGPLALVAFGSQRVSPAAVPDVEEHQSGGVRAHPPCPAAPRAPLTAPGARHQWTAFGSSAVEGYRSRSPPRPMERCVQAQNSGFAGQGLPCFVGWGGEHALVTRARSIHLFRRNDFAPTVPVADII